VVVAFAGSPVVDATGAESGLVEPVDVFPSLGLESEVNVAEMVARRNEELVGEKVSVALAGDFAAERLEDRAIEVLA
jgi:hypothetical protein